MTAEHRGRIDSPSRGSAGVDIRQLMERFREVLADSARTGEEAGPLSQCLAEVMDRRFTEEEREGGRYSELIFRAPWLTAEAEALRQQHAQLRRALDAIVMGATAGRRTPHDCRSLRLQLDDFSELFFEHEAAEHALLQEAFETQSWPDES